MTKSIERLREQRKADLAELKLARQQLRAARKLLERSLDAIPDFVDGRNDRLCNAITKWIDALESA